MDPIERRDIPEKLELFGLKRTDAAVQAAIRNVGIRPNRYAGEPGKKGRVAKYDPMVVWLLAAYWLRGRGVRPELWQPRAANGKPEGPLSRYRQLYLQLTDDASPDRHRYAFLPGFLEDPEFGAQLLMMTSPAHGLEPRLVRELSRKEPGIFDLSVNGREFMLIVLQAYNDAYGQTIAGLPIDGSARQARSAEAQLLDFIDDWRDQVKSAFEMAEFRRTETRHQDEG